MQSVMTDVISIKINYKGFEYPFAANPYALVCFDGNGNFNADYWVSFANEASPHNEVRFVRESDLQECFVLQLSELPSEIKRITAFVFGLCWYPSDLVVTITNQDENIISCMTISSEEIKGKRGFSVVEFTYDGTWNYDMRIELMSEAELNKILEKEKPCLDTNSVNTFNYGQICGDRIKGINPCTQASSEQTFRNIIEKYNLQWNAIVDEVEEYFIRLDEMETARREFKETLRGLLNVDWRKVKIGQLKEVFLMAIESFDWLEPGCARLESEFHHICDAMDEVLFDFLQTSNQKKLNQDLVRGFVADKLLAYKRFTEYLEFFGFERSDEQKANRTKKLKQCE